MTEMKKNIQEAIEGHVETSIEFNDPIPEILKVNMNWYSD